MRCMLDRCFCFFIFHYFFNKGEVNNGLMGQAVEWGRTESIQCWTGVHCRWSWGWLEIFWQADGLLICWSGRHIGHHENSNRRRLNATAAQIAQWLRGFSAITRAHWSDSLISMTSCAFCGNEVAGRGRTACTYARLAGWKARDAPDLFNWHHQCNEAILPNNNQKVLSSPWNIMHKHWNLTSLTKHRI